MPYACLHGIWHESRPSPNEVVLTRSSGRRNRSQICFHTFRWASLHHWQHWQFGRSWVVTKWWSIYQSVRKCKINNNDHCMITVLSTYTITYITATLLTRQYFSYNDWLVAIAIAIAHKTESYCQIVKSKHVKFYFGLARSPISCDLPMFRTLS